MSKKYEKRVKILDEKEQNRKADHDHYTEKHSSTTNGGNINRKSVSKQKKALKDIKKSMDKSRKIW